MDRCGNGLRIILFVIPRRFPFSPQIRKWPLLKVAGKEPFLSSRVDLNSASGCFREHKEGMGEPPGFMIWSMFVLPHPHMQLFCYKEYKDQYGSDSFVLGMCCLCPIILRWITGIAWRLARKYWLFISLELLALNLVLVTNTHLSRHFEFTSSHCPSFRMHCAKLNLGLPR